MNTGRLTLVSAAPNTCRALSPREAGGSLACVRDLRCLSGVHHGHEREIAPRGKANTAGGSDLHEKAAALTCGIGRSDVKGCKVSRIRCANVHDSEIGRADLCRVDDGKIDAFYSSYVGE